MCLGLPVLQIVYSFSISRKAIDWIIESSDNRDQRLYKDIISVQRSIWWKLKTIYQGRKQKLYKFSLNIKKQVLVDYLFRKTRKGRRKKRKRA